jgi:hypothetical protein
LIPCRISHEEALRLQGIQNVAYVQNCTVAASTKATKDFSECVASKNGVANSKDLKVIGTKSLAASLGVLD